MSFIERPRRSTPSQRAASHAARRVHGPSRGPLGVSPGGGTTDQFKTCMLERGFVIHPEIVDAQDGYVRIICSNSIVGNLLNAFK